MGRTGRVITDDLLPVIACYINRAEKNLERHQVHILNNEARLTRLI